MGLRPLARPDTLTRTAVGCSSAGPVAAVRTLLLPPRTERCVDRACGEQEGTDPRCL